MRVEAGAVPVEACGKDAGVVEDEQVGGAEEVGEVSELAVFEGIPRTGKMEQARGRAVGEGFLRDGIRRKIVMEVGD